MQIHNSRLFRTIFKHLFDESFQWSSHRLRICLGRVVRGLGVWCVVAVGDEGGVADKGKGGGGGKVSPPLGPGGRGLSHIRLPRVIKL